MLSQFTHPFSSLVKYVVWIQSVVLPDVSGLQLTLSLIIRQTGSKQRNGNYSWIDPECRTEISQWPGFSLDSCLCPSGAFFIQPRPWSDPRVDRSSPVWSLPDVLGLILTHLEDIRQDYLSINSGLWGLFNYFLEKRLLWSAFVGSTLKRGTRHQICPYRRTNIRLPRLCGERGENTHTAGS